MVLNKAQVEPEAGKEPKKRSPCLCASCSGSNVFVSLVHVYMNKSRLYMCVAG